jgi:DNA-binding NtrC family response regulator/tetratricopeptide (TPR) repeat protein
MADDAAGKVALLREQLDKTTDVTERLRLLTELSDELTNTSPREAEQCFAQLASEASSAGRWECAGMALNDLSYAKFMGGDVAEAIEIARRCLQLGSEHGVGKVRVAAHSMLGLASWQKGEFDEAIRYYEEGWRISREVGYRGGEAAVMGNLGLAYFTRGRLEEAMRIWQQALVLQESLSRDPEMQGHVATTYTNIGRCHEELGDWERAIEHTYRGIALAEELDQKATIAEGRALLASLFWKRGRNDEALRLFKSALEVATEIGWKDGVAEILGGMAEIHLAAGDFLSARNALDRCWTSANELGDRKEIALARRRLAELWLSYPDLARAREEIEQALAMNEELGHQIELGTCLRVKAGISSASGELERARQCYELAIAALSPRGRQSVDRIPPTVGNSQPAASRAPSTASHQFGSPSPEQPALPGCNYQLAIANLAFAQFLWRIEENAAAAERARQAAELFRRLGVLQMTENANRLLLTIRAKSGKSEDAWLAMLQNLSGLAGSSSPLSELALSSLRLLVESLGYEQGAYVLYGRQHYSVGSVSLQQLLALPRSRDLSITPEAVRIPILLRGRHIGMVHLGQLTAGPQSAVRSLQTAMPDAPPPAFWQTVQDLLTLTAERLRRRLASAEPRPPVPDADLTVATIPVKEPDSSSQTMRFGGIIAASPAMNQLLDVVEKVAPTRASVLVCGESGTGKEMIARALHDLSPRQNKPLVIINCAALPETLLEAEIFGIEKGVATGVSARAGKLEQSDGGTLFLDEIGDMSLLLQTKLLRVIQERAFERVGGNRTITVDVRFIAATNRDLEAAVKNGSFRADLYHRLNVIALTIPPLRNRREEIPLLVEHCARTASEEFMRPVQALTSAAMDALLQHSWPGNVRELQNTIQRAVILARDGIITPRDLPPALHYHPGSQPPVHGHQPPTSGSTLKQAKRQARQQATGSLERQTILNALQEHRWQIPQVTAALGVSRSHLYRLMKRHGIKAAEHRQQSAERSRQSPDSPVL